MPSEIDVLKARLRDLEDLEAIRTLRYWYGQHANIEEGHGGDLDAFAALFAQDAVWDVGLGAFQGPSAIKAAMQGVTTQWVSVMHLMMNPLITLDGDRAHGTWTGLFPFISKQNPRPIWSSLVYLDEYVRTSAGWKFQTVRIRQIFQPPEFHEMYADFLATQKSS